MKLKAFVSGTTAIFAATLIGYGQTPAQDQQQQQQQPGAAQQQPGAAQQQPGAAQQQPEAAQQQQQQGMQEIAEQYQKWEDAERSEVSLDEVPERARNTIEGIVRDSAADSAEEIVSLEKDEEKVFHAKIAPEGQKELQVFVQEDGTVVSTVQETEFTAAPQNIRTAVQKELTGEATTPEEFHRVTVRGQTAYVAKVEAEDETKMILISQDGETTELKKNNNN